MSQITEMALEATLQETLERINVIQAQIPAAQGKVDEWTSKLSEYNIKYATASPTIKAIMTNSGVKIVLTSNLTLSKTKLKQLQDSLTTELKQKVLDQGLINDYKVSNMSPEEVAEHTIAVKNAETEIIAARNEAELKGKMQSNMTTLITVLLVVAAIVALIYFVKKSKVIKL